jgi:hypothetical protein
MKKYISLFGVRPAGNSADAREKMIGNEKRRIRESETLAGVQEDQFLNRGMNFCLRCSLSRNLRHSK